MKILLINSFFAAGGPPRIVNGLYEEFKKQGHQCKIAAAREKIIYPEDSVQIGSDLGVKINALKARFFDNDGFNAKLATKKFLEWAKGYDPDLLWLHNLHGYYINIEMLFDWIKARPQMQVKWTLHDCWAFTGHCAYFSFEKCNRWEQQCFNCPQLNCYPKAYKDNSKNNYIKKKAAFTGVKNMTLITPSKWLADLVARSFLKEYKTEVVYNKINTDIFKPTQSDFRKKYGLENKKIVLGVANVWDRRKGFDDFLKLSRMLDDDFRVVLVGLSEKQINSLPENIIGITRTNNAIDLAGIYTAADIFVNPSVEETFGLTTVEALSCGTPAIVYKDTACEEIAEKYGGIVVEQGNIIALVNEIKRLSE